MNVNTLRAENITVSRKGKLILDSVSFTLQPGTLTAIIGPNGAGKTTLMRALSGERPDKGQLFINNHNVYDDPEYWLPFIGYVPVDNILHEQLALEEAMMYIGLLRLPDTPLEKIKSRVDDLLAQFGFPPGDERRGKLIGVLSSGERKRANVCSELILDPKILMLDEPTSNLDPNAEYNLMVLLRKFAHERRKIILVITHTLNTIDLCDQVLFIENACLRVMGQPDDVLQKVEIELDVDTLAFAPHQTLTRWAAVFDKTQTKPEARKDFIRPARPGRKQIGSQQSAKRVSWWKQFTILLKRYSRVRLADKLAMLGILAAGVISGILFFILPGKVFVKPFDLNERMLALNLARQGVYLISIVVTFLGMITSYTEISKEFRIYRHERLKGLSPSAYLLSKWVWLTGAVGIFAPILLMIFLVLVYQQPLPGFAEPHLGETVTWLENLLHIQLVGLLTQPTSWLVLITMILSCITSITVGLLISAFSGDDGKGYLYLSFVVVFIVLFSGLVRNPKLGDLIDQFSILSTGKWSYEGIASSISVYCWLDSWHFDEYNSTGHIISVWLSLIVFTAVAMYLSIFLLRMRDPWYERGVNIRLLFTRHRTSMVVFLSVMFMLLSYTFFFRSLSVEYHSLNYWNRSEYGGTNAYQYASIYDVENPDLVEYWSGALSQSWCSTP